MPVEQISTSVERKLLIGLIISKRFCANIASLVKTEYLSAPYSKRVAEWAINHYLKYDSPINDLIQDTFNRESASLKPEESELIKELLLSISSEYDEENQFNVDYWTDACLDFLKRKGMESVVEKINNNLKLNRISEAEQSLFGYSTIAKETSKISTMANIEKVVDEVFDTKSTELFCYPGDIGRIMGPVRRKGVHAIFSTGKGGKTFFAVELALEAVKHGHHVLFSSHEMSGREVQQRLIQVLCRRSYKEEGAIGEYALFDCVGNRQHKCRLAQRTNQQRYIIGAKGKEHINPEYLPCDVCRGVSDLYDPAFFSTKKEKPTITKEYAAERLDTFMKYEGGNRLHIIGFPQFSATFKDVEDCIEYLRSAEGIDIAVNVDDYINGHKINKGMDRRIAVMDEWRYAKKMADELNIAVISPLHANREGMKALELNESHISECQDAYNTLTSMVAIDTTPDLDAYGVVRMRKLADRFGGYKKHNFCYITQCLNHGTFVDQSYFSEFNDKFTAYKDDKK